MNGGPAVDTRRGLPAVALTLCCLVACGPRPAPGEPATSADAVVVEAPHLADRLGPVFEAYTAETGIRVVLLGGGPALPADRLHGTPAGAEPDFYIADDIAGLWEASEQNLLRPTRAGVVDGRIPVRLRDPDKRWVALSARFRTVVYNPALVSDADLATVDGYASLAAETWHARLCLSSSAVGGNRSLIAMLIMESGPADAERTVRGWRANLAAAPFGDDRGLLVAIADGRCAIGVAASSEIARFLAGHSGAPIAPFRFASPGTLHVVVSGGGVARHAHNPEGAASLLAWLTSDVANAMYAAALLDLPANPAATVAAELAAWAGTEANPAAIAGLGFLLDDAARLAERARYR